MILSFSGKPIVMRLSGELDVVERPYARDLARVAGLVLGCLLLSSCSDNSTSEDGRRAESRSRHVLLITLDTTRQDHLGIYGRRVAGRTTTPTMDDFGATGRSYKRAFTSTPLTLPSHTTMLTGMEPPQHGVRENNDFRLVAQNSRSFTTVAEDLSEKGYATGAFVSSRVMASEFGLGAGFDVYDEVQSTGGGGHSHYDERGAIETTSAALSWFDKVESNASLMWVHFFDPHHPYRAHPGRADAVVKAGGSPYDGEVAFVDGQIGRLFRAYKERGLWDDTLVLIVGDHGEGFGEHGEESHGFLLHDATMRIPFLAKSPADMQLQKKREFVRTVDVTPTIQEFARVKIHGESVGRSLFQSIEDDAVSYGETVYPFRQFGWAALWSLRSENWLYIEGGGKTLLYDHRKDFDEKNDLATKDVPRTKSMRGRLLKVRRQLKSLIDSDSRKVEPGMRSNAYLGGPSPDVPAEPTVDENKKLAHPRDRMGTLNQLNRLTRLLETLQARSTNGAAATQSDQAFVDLQILTDLMRERRDQSPAIQFWLGRADWKLGVSSQARAISKKYQAQLLERGFNELTSYLKQRSLDYRAWNMRLSISLSLWHLSGDKVQLGRIMALAKEQEGRGLDDGLMHCLRGLALEASGKLKEACASFEVAVKKSPRNASFRRDRDRLRQKNIESK
ncbi:MAG: arylsulfatase A-like enzyme [Planctomycetota bacterium]|jgi:arylsulfatase A-like enzyme